MISFQIRVTTADLIEYFITAEGFSWYWSFILTLCFSFSDVINKEGQEHVYQYEGHVMTGIPNLKQQYSGMKIDCTVRTLIHSHNTVIMQVNYTITHSQVNYTITHSHNTVIIQVNYTLIQSRYSHRADKLYTNTFTMKSSCM